MQKSHTYIVTDCNQVPAFSQADVVKSGKNVVTQSIFDVKGQVIREGYTAAQYIRTDFPTAMSFAFVERLGVPGALAETDGVVVVDA
jgi:hypothetical protein